MGHLPGVVPTGGVRHGRLTSRIDDEGAASKQRDRQMLQGIERRSQEMDAREAQLRTLLAESTLGLRRELSERLDQHNVRLEMLEQAVLQVQEAMRHLQERLPEVHGEHRQLVTRLYARGLLAEPTSAPPPAA